MNKKKLIKGIIFLIYFFLPFVFWIILYFSNLDFLIIARRDIDESSVIIFKEDLIKFVTVFFVIQFGNLILKFLTFDKIFDKINFVFILGHILISFYTFYFNLL